MRTARYVKEIWRSEDVRKPADIVFTGVSEWDPPPVAIEHSDFTMIVDVLSKPASSAQINVHSAQKNVHPMCYQRYLISKFRELGSGTNLAIPIGRVN